MGQREYTKLHLGFLLPGLRAHSANLQPSCLVLSGRWKGGLAIRASRSWGHKWVGGLGEPVEVARILPAHAGWAPAALGPALLAQRVALASYMRIRRAKWDAGGWSGADPGSWASKRQARGWSVFYLQPALHLLLVQRGVCLLVPPRSGMWGAGGLSLATRNLLSCWSGNCLHCLYFPLFFCRLLMPFLQGPQTPHRPRSSVWWRPLRGCHLNMCRPEMKRSPKSSEP